MFSKSNVKQVVIMAVGIALGTAFLTPLISDLYAKIRIYF